MGDSLEDVTAALTPYGLQFGESELLNENTGCGIAVDTSNSVGLVTVPNEGVRVFVVGSAAVPVDNVDGVRVGDREDDVRAAWYQHTGSDAYQSPVGGERLIVQLPELSEDAEGPLSWDGGRAAMFETDEGGTISRYRVGDARYASHINWCDSPEDAPRKEGQDDG
ncbi:hypothetical protein GCM10009616_19730 [Microlunatus lacustris]